jgi:hypothetical protein
LSAAPADARLDENDFAGLRDRAGCFFAGAARVRRAGLVLAVLAVLRTRVGFFFAVTVLARRLALDLVPAFLRVATRFAMVIFLDEPARN